MAGFDGDADALGPGVFGVGLGATKQRKRNEILITLIWKNERKAVLNSVWLKES
jgi:hypothetical protein